MADSGDFPDPGGNGPLDLAAGEVAQMKNALPADTLASRLLAMTYEPFLRRAENRGMRATRSELLGGALGMVLEIGAGTGLNLQHYPHDLTELVLTEPVPAMYRRLRRRVAQNAKAVAVQASASAIPLADASVDTVVSTLVLCTVPDVQPVLAEIARVLKPGGTLLFCEHVLSQDVKLAQHQKRLAPYWAVFAGGCRCDRDTETALASQFDIKRIDTAQWSGMPSLVLPLIIGTAARN
jgi:SAM-dependent methyltransferase